MRITSTMMTNNILLNLNRSKQTMASLEEQLATGKQIQKPSDDPIIAARALKFRTNLSEIEQYQTNTNDAASWLSITEQAISNTTDIIQRISELAVQGSSGTMTINDRTSMVSEIEQLKAQIVNEGNVSYAGRYVFTGYQTGESLIYTEADDSETFAINEHLGAADVETVSRVYGDLVNEVSRIRLGYDTINEATVPSTIAGFTVQPMSSQETLSSTPPGTYEAYEPASGEVHFLEDTGELIFNSGDLASIPDDFDFMYEKNEFDKADLRPNHYFDCENLDTGDEYTKANEGMNYQISYSQDIQVNVMGYDVFGVDMVRDMEELISQTNAITGDGSISNELKEDLLSDSFSSLIGKCSNYIQNNSNVTAIIGGKQARLELTLSRLAEDELNFTDLLSENEDVDMAEALISFSAQEVVYNAALSSSSRVIQSSLLDFLG